MPDATERPAIRTNATTRSFPASTMRSSSQCRSGNDSAQDVNQARTSSCPRCTEYSGSDCTGTHSISGCRLTIRESRLVWSSRSQNCRTISTFSSDIVCALSRAKALLPMQSGAIGSLNRGFRQARDREQLDLTGEALRVEAGELADPAQPVAHGVGVDVEGLGGSRHVEVRVQVD